MRASAPTGPGRRFGDLRAGQSPAPTVAVVFGKGFPMMRAEQSPAPTVFRGGFRVKAGEQSLSLQCPLFLADGFR